MREVNDEPHLVLCACFHLTHRMQALNIMYLSPQDLPCSLETSFLWDNQDRNIQLSEEAVCQSSRRWVSAFSLWSILRPVCFFSANFSHKPVHLNVQSVYSERHWLFNSQAEDRQCRRSHLMSGKVKHPCRETFTDTHLCSTVNNRRWFEQHRSWPVLLLT